MGRLESEIIKMHNSELFLFLLLFTSLFHVSSLQEESDDPFAMQPVNKSQDTTAICSSPHLVAKTAEELIKVRYPCAVSL